MSPVIDCTTEDARAEAVARAAAAVRDGRLVVLPTDTVYGIGADAFNAAAVTAVLAAKGRGREMPPAVLVSSPHTVDGLATEVPGYARRLMEAFWPGSLTLILRAHASLMWDLGETNGTVGLRMPDDAVALALLSQTGPMAVSSANRSGEPPAASVLEAAAMFGPAVEIYLDGGPARGSVASTIVDCTRDELVVLRQGGIPEAEIRRVASGTGPRSAAG
ncbi:translation factor SUA5 [Austwickia chelonae]|nr:L-threonylcarbamoyladenylate synthase [Austwickia chelonae]SEW29800.1 translation factor SUA5 [Austwickia chelonae]